MDPITYVKNYCDEKINIRPVIHKLPTKEVIICRMAIGEMEPYDQTDHNTTQNVYRQRKRGIMYPLKDNIKRSSYSIIYWNRNDFPKREN